jgi:hypothetical protein
VSEVFHDLSGPAGDLSFRPLARLESPEALSWAQGWLLDLLRNEGLEPGQAVKDALWSALQNLAAGPVTQRTLTVLAATVQDRDIEAALAPYALGAGRALIENAFSKLKPCCAKPPPEPSNSFGRPLPMPSTPSHPTNAPTTSPRAATMQTDRKML